MRLTLAFTLLAVVFASSPRLRARFEAWVQRTDWHRIHLRLNYTATWLLFVIGCFLLHALVIAWTTGAIERATR